MILRRGFLILVITILMVVAGTPKYQALAHGSMQNPISRVYGCFLEGPESPDSQACIDAIATGGTQPLYDWSEVNIRDAGGNSRTIIPDGHLCSANRDKYAAYDMPRNDWPTTLMQPGPFNFKWAVWANHVVSQFEIYLTKDGFNPLTPLKWSDLELLFTWGPPTLNADSTYTFTGNIPARTGRHILYTVWQRADSAEAFYSCSDVFFGTLPTPTPPPPCTAPAWSSTTVYQSGEIVSYNNAEWQDQWYVQGEPPARTEE